MRYNLVVCGGTFDHFHKGHKAFLRHILSVSSKVLLGLTTDSYVKTKNDSGRIEGYRVRKRQIEEFLDQQKAKNRVRIEPIEDIFIPKIWEELPIEAIVVSSSTIRGAEQINLKRKEQGKSSLIIEIVNLINDENNEYISSSRIRNGKIDREGKRYVKNLWFKKNLKLTPDLRKQFQKPFGELFTDIDKALISKNKKSLVITVGDITTKIFNDKSLGQNVSVIDFKVAREKKFSNISELGFTGDEEILKVDNPAGYISSDLFIKLAEIFRSERKRKTVLQINGEEDLVVLSIILLAPLGTAVFYGQPDKGIVKVEVSEESKDRAYELISKFEVLDSEINSE